MVKKYPLKDDIERHMNDVYKMMLLREMTTNGLPLGITEDLVENAIAVLRSDAKLDAKDMNYN